GRTASVPLSVPLACPGPAVTLTSPHPPRRMSSNEEVRSAFNDRGSLQRAFCRMRQTGGTGARRAYPKAKGGGDRSGGEGGSDSNRRSDQRGGTRDFGER